MKDYFNAMLDSLSKEELVEIAKRMKSIQRDNELQLEILAGRITMLAEVANENGKWHDLRTNPEDIPEKVGNYLVYYENNEPVDNIPIHREFYKAVTKWEPEIGHFKATAWSEMTFVRRRN